MRGTLALSWGAYGGFYVRRHDAASRVCLGRLAVTYIPNIEIDALVRAWADKPLGELEPIARALHDVWQAEDAERAAYESRRAAELRLAELVGTRRRDKDMGFDADFEARRAIVDAVVALLVAGEGEQS